MLVCLGSINTYGLTSFPVYDSITKDLESVQNICVGEY